MKLNELKEANVKLASDFVIYIVTKDREHELCINTCDSNNVLDYDLVPKKYLQMKVYEIDAGERLTIVLE